MVSAFSVVTDNLCEFVESVLEGTKIGLVIYCGLVHMVQELLPTPKELV